MTIIRKTVLVPALVLATTIGCIKRSETITIFEDGRVRLETEIVGDPDDVHNGGAMPTAQSGWQVTDRTETDAEGKEELTRIAKREIPAGQPLPSSYAPPDSRLDLIALQFPTTVTIEQRSDGTYYHFKRVYRRRDYADVQYWKDKVTESDEIKAITQKEPDQVTQEERAKLAEALIDIEANQTAAFVEQAGLAIPNGISQDALLQARRGASNVFEANELTDRVIELLGKNDDAAADELAGIEREVFSRVREGIETGLADGGVRRAVIDQFLNQYELAREAFATTEDLGDETWFVGVEMPGRVIAHNSSGDPGQKFAEMLQPVEQEGVTRQSTIETTVRVEKNGQAQDVTSIQTYESRSNKVAWEFDGKALRDRDVVLMATSFVQNTEE